MSKEWFILQFKSNSHHLAAKNLTDKDLKHSYPYMRPLHEDYLDL